ncbi:MAG TPA: aldolase/citrate lyase family protein [Phycisphaerae bacterium]|nr:aldolase/citrate lyase family protein [Phycisphaerae bacterium]HOJ73002.1 aldolase/citrate lyase family protein [Phycisphaerae bacterium]HOM50186.1 aldolase/citrate lyase family protein [Phycisphaerae bacterium]HON67046.1 aldolase/citrate lyase family protein [Phycisphaerae bacterium]HOQ87289.1 aldolase/citrate lyase family protein [Phycisphaerae bacterium]
MKNKLRRALLDRKVTLGAWMQIGHCAVAEIFARAGFDWVCVDLEHGAIDLETTTNIFRTLAAFDCVPVARLPLNDPVWIHRTLDAGARALIIPMVKTAAEAEAAVREAKYPPRGTRGYGYSRANMHGMDFSEYITEANDEIAMIMQIEHKDAIGNLEAILDVPGVDGLFIGPLDLSGSMGITGQLDHPQMVAALDRYRSVCRERGVTAGMHIVRPNPENISQAIEQGYTLIALGLDNVFLDDSSRACLKAAGRS